MGRFIRGLSKFGKSAMRALTSKKAQAIYSGIGELAKRAAESKVGTAVIDGVIQGAAQSAITGEAMGETVKNAVILNVLEKHDAIPDPISPGEQAIYRRMKQLEEGVLKNEHVISKQKEIEELIGDELKQVRKYSDVLAEGEVKEQKEIKLLNNALTSMKKIMSVEEKNIQKLAVALRRESSDRTATEERMVSEYRHNIENLRNAIEIERNAATDEAIQQIAEVSADVMEAAAEEVPIVGAAGATAIASARAIAASYKLKNIIENLSGIDLSHFDVAKIQPATIEAILDTPVGGSIDDVSLVRGLEQKMEKVRDVINETAHIQAVVKEKENHLRNVQKVETRELTTRLKNKVPTEMLPKIHIYVAPWGSEDIFFFHCLPPYHQPESFLLGFDLEMEYVYYEDLRPTRHDVSGNLLEVTGRSFVHAYKDFFLAAEQVEGITLMHKKRLERDRLVHPLYLGSISYDVSFNILRNNAMQIVHNDELQKHMLRGPKHFQRRVILQALRYGIKLLDEELDPTKMLHFL
uniref:Outer capsid protein VP5 n=1 Tax=Ife virus TaxID=2547357 RepID=A0A482A4M1_9REOV|nr:VP5 [Ife virus]